MQDGLIDQLLAPVLDRRIPDLPETERRNVLASAALAPPVASTVDTSPGQPDRGRTARRLRFFVCRSTPDREWSVLRKTREISHLMAGLIPKTHA